MRPVVLFLRVAAFVYNYCIFLTITKSTSGAFLFLYESIATYSVQIDHLWLRYGRLEVVGPQYSLLGIIIFWKACTVPIRRGVMDWSEI